MKRLATDWDKISANIYAIEYMQTEYAKNSYNRQIKQQIKYTYREYAKEDIQMANKHRKWYSISVEKYKLKLK